MRTGKQRRGEVSGQERPGGEREDRSRLVQGQLLNRATPGQPLITWGCLWLQLRACRWEENAGDIQLLTHRHIPLESGLYIPEPASPYPLHFILFYLRLTLLRFCTHPTIRSLILQITQSSCSRTAPRATEHPRYLPAPLL